MQLRETSREPELFREDSRGTGDDSDTSEENFVRGYAICHLSLAEVWLSVVALVWFVGGIVMAMRCLPANERDAVTALYFVAQVTTGVGYGDVVPEGNGFAMRFLVGLYVLTGSVIATLGITSRLHHIVDRGKHQIRKAMKSDDPSAVLGGHDPVQASKHNTWAAAMICGLSILSGTVYYGCIDTCICNGLDCGQESWTHDSWAIPTDCEVNRNVPDAFYMSCVTLTTVGFGDMTPKSLPGRLFGSFFMIFGVASMANLLMEVAHLFSVMLLEHAAEQGIGEKLFKKIDTDNDGCLSRFEYVIYMLIEHGLADSADIELLLAQFSKFDADGSGVITLDELGLHMDGL